MRFKFVFVLLCLWLSVIESAPTVRCLLKSNIEGQWSMDCSSLKLVDFPTNVMHYPVVNLTMSRNNVQSPQHLSNWTDLRYLDLSYNRIHNISDDMFQNMQNIVYLNLSHNSLGAIGEYSFSKLVSLQVLDLSANKEIGKKFYYYTPSIKKALTNGLKELHLASVGIEHIPSDMFENANQLQLLDLRNNNLKELPVFPQFLTDLDLSSNLLETLSLPPFLHCESLSTLSLNNNTHLEDIETGALQNLHNLTTLSLKGCKKLEKPMYDIFNNNGGSKKAESSPRTHDNSSRTILLKLDELELTIPLCDNDHLTKWFSKLNSSASASKIVGAGVPSGEEDTGYFQVKLSHSIIRYVLILVTFIAFVMVPLSVWFAVKMERRRREDKPELKIEKIPLYDPSSDMPPQNPNCVYVTTTQRT